MTHYAIPASLSIPYGDIDAEHQELIDILNSMALQFEKEQGGEPVSYGSLLGNLRGALSTHFMHEEREMTRLSYPDLTRHKSQHAVTYSRLNAIVQTVANKQIQMSAKLLGEIFNVIVSDIIRADSGFKSFLYAQNILK